VYPSRPQAATPARRIDGADLKRVVPWDDGGKERNWVSEETVNLVTGGGPSEAEGAAGLSPEEQATVTRRLLIGGGLSSAAIALALIPDKAFNPKANKPLFFYLVPLLRVQSLLDELDAPIAEARWDEVAATVRRIKGEPYNLRQNLDFAASFLEDARQYERVKAVETEVMEYLSNVDFQTYFDTMGNARGGRPTADLVKFSTSSLALAKERLRLFISLMPAEQVTAAKQQLAAPL
jgi:hypothetical protein